MRNYIIRRLLLLIPTVLLVSAIAFLLVRLIPGTVVEMMLAQMKRFVPEATMARLRAEMGMDVPVFTQFGRWLGVLPQADGGFRGIFQGNLGDSLLKRTPVMDSIANAWPVTLQLGFMGLIIGQIIALPIGLYSALRQDTWGDYISRSFAIACIAIPGFWLGTMAIVFPSIWWGYMPPIMLIPFVEDPIGNLQMFIVPAIVLGMAMAGMTMRMTRTMVLEVLRQDYIRTAWAKGLRERVVIIRHALRNALIPVVTLIGLGLPVMIGGTVIIEQIFSLPGMGRLLISATHQRDYPTVSGIIVVFAFGTMLINLLIDLTYAYLDPRVHYG